MLKYFILVATFIMSSFGHSKIADPPGVFAKGRFFCSHGNTVFAVKTSNKDFRCHYDSADSNGAKKVWETVLPFAVEPEKYDPNLEQDVQWCIVGYLAVEGPYILALDCKGKKYWLSQKTGKLKKTK